MVAELGEVEVLVIILWRTGMGRAKSEREEREREKRGRESEEREEGERIDSLLSPPGRVVQRLEGAKESGGRGEDSAHLLLSHP